MDKVKIFSPGDRVRFCKADPEHHPYIKKGTTGVITAGNGSRDPSVDVKVDGDGEYLTSVEFLEELA